MKLIIAGGRNYHLGPDEWQWLDDLPPVSEVVCGGATGADQGGADWAHARGLPVSMFIPEWKRYGHAAGPMRNGLMAEYADAVALFPGGKGTSDMRRQAKAKGLRVYEYCQ